MEERKGKKMGLNRREKWSGATGSRKALLDLSQSKQEV